MQHVNKKIHQSHFTCNALLCTEVVLFATTQGMCPQTPAGKSDQLEVLPDWTIMTLHLTSDIPKQEAGCTLPHSCKRRFFREVNFDVDAPMHPNDRCDGQD
jgi:hypothetical protein